MSLTYVIGGCQATLHRSRAAALTRCEGDLSGNVVKEEEEDSDMKLTDWRQQVKSNSNF